MKIVICGSSTFRKEKVAIKEKLLEMGHDPIIDPVTEKLARGEDPELLNRIATEHHEVKKELDLIRWYYNAIVGSDAILVVNPDKRGIANYIGGNTLLEIGYAYVHGKTVFLLNQVPEISYKDEILAMYSEVLDGDLERLRGKA
ncbi:MAG: hypothetical protein HGB18_00015 [Candidatus Moranbacteria bacterium]|nr:hypothetical protein [Candidatus Moranbacteria bacterium]